MKRNVKKNKEKAQKTRKELRKEQRLLKKARKNEFFQRKKNPSKLFITNSDESIDNKINHQIKKTRKTKQEKHFATDKDEVEKLQKDMQKQRIKQLIKANEDEEKQIKKLEKQLKLYKHKRKSVPKSFAEDGLDYLLEVCEQDNLKQAVFIDQTLHESGSEFEEDFIQMTGIKKKDKNQKKENDTDDSSEEQNNDSGSEISVNSDVHNKEEISISSSDVSNYENDTTDKQMRGVKRQTNVDECKINKKRKKLKKNKSLLQQFVEENIEEEQIEFKNVQGKTRGITSDFHTEDSEKHKQKKKNAYRTTKYNKITDEFGSDNELDIQEDQILEEDSDNDENMKEEEKQIDEYWEDIYGRTRDKQGNVVQVEKSKYLPPYMRARETNENSKNQEQLIRLKKQMKGLINRLAESNMSSISSQIEELYMSNSRNDMNESLMNLLLESLVVTVITPERLIMEHAMLIAILHANVGTEIGAHVLQTLIKKFNEQLQVEQEIENKEMDNIVLILSHLYNFKVFNAILMYNILDKLAESFGEKEVELILLILKNIGFSLRKNDPLALKDLIVRLQQKAGKAVQSKNSARVKFMLEVLLAIKNNNMSKIPNYDPGHIEHLKKLMKGFLRKGNYITELKISLEDLLKADERGRWWVVGSAWTGEIEEKGPFQDKQQNTSNQYSKQLLELAQKHRMNTDVRKNIFCILMTAEDYLDAFEKLLHLGLKNQQEREIIYVIMHCCLQEKQFNPYYCHLAQKFCDFDRKFQIIIQYALWDRFKDLQNVLSFQLTNLAKFLLHLIIEKGLPLSVLKVIHFTEVDKITVKFLRQLLLGLLLHKSEEEIQQAFQRVALSKNLHIFREGIRLFIHHFVLRNLQTHSVESVKLLQQRAKMAVRILGAAESKVKF